MRLIRGNLKASLAVFSGNGQGLVADGSNVALSNCTFSHNSIGLVAQDFASLVASGSQFVNNRTWGVALYKRAGTPKSVVTRYSRVNSSSSASKSTRTATGTSLVPPSGQGRALFDGCRIENNSVAGSLTAKPSQLGQTTTDVTIRSPKRAGCF